MNAGASPARQMRVQHRHPLHTMTYLTLDNVNGGVVRNLTDKGMGAQVVTAVRPRQQLRVRFELRYPRLRVETRGEVVWATFSGQCGIRFLDLPPSMARQINEWILGNLLEGISVHLDAEPSMFMVSPMGQAEPEDVTEVVDEAAEAEESDDGLIVSPTPVKVIPLHSRKKMVQHPESLFFPVLPVTTLEPERELSEPQAEALDWITQPLSGRGLEWAVHTLVVCAGILLFVLVFLAITREAPHWPLAMAAGAAFVISGLYWAFFHLFGGSSLGARLARLAGYGQDDDGENDGPRFR